MIDDVFDHLRRAKRVLFITGAGVSADSGLPTYRGVGGIYADADTPDGVPIEVALSGQMFRKDPALTWRYLLQVEEACRGAKPNRAHEVMAALESRMEVVVLTQNVDGLHTDAGSSTVIEIHGNLRRLECTVCPWKDHVPNYVGLETTCPNCGRGIRPAVILFGEMLPELAVRRLDNALSKPFDLVFSVGTTSVFPYIAAPMEISAQAGLPTVEINPSETRVSHLATWRLRQGAAEVLDALHTRLER